MIKINTAIIRDKLYIPKNQLPADYKSKFIRATADSFINVMGNRGDYWVFPSGCLEYFDVENLIDETTWEPLDIPFKGTLRDYQEDLIKDFIKVKQRGMLIQAPCSFGKTFISAWIASHYGATLLVLVHTRLLLYQWIKELQNLTGLDIGIVGDQKFDIKPITVGLYQSINNNIDSVRNFSVCIVDEVHRAGAEIYSETLNNINARYKIGLSATPSRRDGKHILFPDFFGTTLLKGDSSSFSIKPKVKILATPVSFIMKNPKKEWSTALNKLYINPTYLNIVVNELLKLNEEGRCVLVVADRIEFLRTLNQKLAKSAILIGTTKESERNEILEGAGDKYDYILSTTIFDEGVSCHRLDTLLCCSPSSNFEKLQQRIGRIEREHPEKRHPLVLDLWLRGANADKQQRNRYLWYKEQGYEVF